jgi:hypothetical protein
VLHGYEAEGSDLDLLADALAGTTLFDLGGLQPELEAALPCWLTQWLSTLLYSTWCYNFSCTANEFSRQKHLTAGQESC